MTRRRRRNLGILVQGVGWLLVCTGLAFAAMLSAPEINAMMFMAAAVLATLVEIAGIACLHWSIHISDKLKRGVFCPACEYDLRGQADDGCPECGWGRSLGTCDGVRKP